MSGGLHKFLLASLLTVAGAWPAHAEKTGEQQDLYLDAMQAIAEGRKSDASATLTRMIEKEPQHAGAWLDLALIQCQLGHADEAERLFSAIETRFAPPPGILEVIAKQRVAGCVGLPTPGHWTLMLGRGTDQNVNQGASNPNYTIGHGDAQQELELGVEYLRKKDQYTVLSGEYLHEIGSNGLIGFMQFQGRHNDRLKDFNTASLFAGLEQPWSLGDWRLRGTGLFGIVSLGGKLYQRQSQLQARLIPPLPLPSSLQFQVLAGLTHFQYLRLSNFDSNTVEVRGQLNYQGKDTQAQLAVAYLSDHAVAARPSGNRNGWLASAQVRRHIFGDVTGELAWSRQTWHSQFDYLPGFIDEKRHQATQVWRATLSAPLGNKQTLNIDLRQVRNKENISFFQYNNRQLQVSWQWQGF